MMSSFVRIDSVHVNCMDVGGLGYGLVWVGFGGDTLLLRSSGFLSVVEVLDSSIDEVRQSFVRLLGLANRWTSSSR
jgi:hypothetical protein